MLHIFSSCTKRWKRYSLCNSIFPSIMPSCLHKLLRLYDGNKEFSWFKHNWHSMKPCRKFEHIGTTCVALEGIPNPFLRSSLTDAKTKYFTGHNSYGSETENMQLELVSLPAFSWNCKFYALQHLIAYLPIFVIDLRGKCPNICSQSFPDFQHFGFGKWSGCTDCSKLPLAFFWLGRAKLNKVLAHYLAIMISSTTWCWPSITQQVCA